ncbi:hypothetical protein CRG98_040903 [Punica granatum]|uniref:Legume lectin domain-containing protein n=1 Tax=Punica granatum TaxID=22663 RepID=A0A2I0I3W6_PUNGR|nr:hypothetical protein CRG98_040903 [Punica granatum]
MKLLWFWAVIGLVLSECVYGFEFLDFNVTEESYVETIDGVASQANNALLVGLTLIRSAGAKGAASELCTVDFSFNSG